jgi:hypothetical protein
MGQWDPTHPEYSALSIDCGNGVNGGRNDSLLAIGVHGSDVELKSD